MWVEFVVDSRPCSEGFSPGSPVFLPPQKPTLLNSNSTWNARTPLNEFLELFGASWVNKLHLHLQGAEKGSLLRGAQKKMEGKVDTGTHVTFCSVAFLTLFN